MVNLSLFRQFIPLATLTATDRSELAKRARVGSYQPGHTIFQRGDEGRTVLYLVSGEVELLSDNGTRVVKAGTEAAKHPIAQANKRAATATCVKAAQILFVDREQLDMILTWAQTGTVEVQEIGGDEGESQDWMSAILQNPAFYRVPPANIAQMLASLRPVHVKAGETIIQQGTPGDFYYVVTAGRCQVVHQDPDGLNERELAQLGVGQGFGEEALVSGNPRSATVRALTEVELMRLSSADFERFLKAPMLTQITPEEIDADALLIDVRLPEEYKQGRLPGAINLPLMQLRTRAHELDPSKIYVVYCDTGRRSASATYLLSERGIDARLLSGGVSADEMPVRG